MQSEVKRWIDTSVKGAKRGQGSDEQRPYDAEVSEVLPPISRARPELTP